MEEIISMSPADRRPSANSIKVYRQSRSSLAALSPRTGSSSALNLSNLEEKVEPYFGQKVAAHDLVATGIENAFDRL